MPCSFHVLLVPGIILVETAQHSQRKTGALAWATPNPGLQRWRGQAVSPRSVWGRQGPAGPRAAAEAHAASTPWLLAPVSAHLLGSMDRQAKHGLSGKHLLKHQAAARATRGPQPCVTSHAGAEGAELPARSGVPRWAVTGSPRRPLTLGATSC